MNCLFKGFTRIVSKITGFVNYITVKNMMRYHPVFDRNSKRTEKVYKQIIVSMLYIVIR